MVIEVKDGNNTYIFDDWKTDDPTFMWYRELINKEPSNRDPHADETAGILLLQFDGYWSIRFINSYLFEVVKDVYRLICPEDRAYLDATEAKEDIDRFLNRVNSLKSFL